MPADTQTLAEQFEAANEEMLRFVEGCDDTQWQTLVPDEGRTVGVVSHHVAGAYSFQSRLIRHLASGQPSSPVSSAQIDDANVRHMERHANCTREETADLLRRNGARAADLVRGLDSDELERQGYTGLYGDRLVTPRLVIERTLIGHVRSHLEGLRAALAGPGQDLGH